MTEIEKTPQEPGWKFPSSLRELKLPTFQETELLVREGEEMLKKAAEDRRKKSGPFDVASWNAPIGIKASSESVAPVPAPVIK